MTLFFTLLAITVFLYFAAYLWKLDTDYINQLRKENTMNPLFPPYVPEDEYFTQAEAQQLSSLLKLHLYNAECQRNYMLGQARWKKGQGEKEAVTAYYNQADKFSEFIKKYGKLQSKLKHSIHTRG